MGYEYIRLAVDLGDLKELNSLSGVGWRVVAFVPDMDYYWALLERELPKRYSGDHLH